MVFHRSLILRTLITTFKGDANDVVHSSQTEDMPAFMPKIPAVTAPQDEIASIIDHQFISTRCGGYYKFLVKWKHRSTSDSAWVKRTQVQQLHPDLFTAYVMHMLIITCWSPVLQERQQLMKIRRQRKVTCNPRSLLDTGDVRDKEKLLKAY